MLRRRAAEAKPLGIVKGKPFAPDAWQKRILEDATVVDFRMAQTLSAARLLDIEKA